jgi:hypothetical protein
MHAIRLLLLAAALPAAAQAQSYSAQPAQRTLTQVPPKSASSRTVPADHPHAWPYIGAWKVSYTPARQGTPSCTLAATANHGATSYTLSFVFHDAGTRFTLAYSGPAHVHGDSVRLLVDGQPALTLPVLSRTPHGHAMVIAADIANQGFDKVLWPQLKRPVGVALLAADAGGTSFAVPMGNTASIEAYLWQCATAAGRFEQN